MSGVRKGTRRLALLYEGLERLHALDLRGATIAFEQVVLAAAQLRMRQRSEIIEGHQALAAGSRLESLSTHATQRHDELLKRQLLDLRDGRRELAATLEESRRSAGCARQQMDKLVAHGAARVARQGERRDQLAASDRHLAQRDVLHEELLREE